MYIKRFVVSLVKISCRQQRKYSKSITNSNLKATLLNMPRERQNNNNRSKIKEKNVKYTPGTVTLQVLGSGALGGPAVLYLFTDQNRYLFNCGEGTQRLAHEHKTRLSRLEHVFFTRRCWHRMGGLPGLSLTLQETGVQNLCLHGPPDIHELFKATKRFVVLRDLQIRTVQAKAHDVFEDSVMTVHYIPLFRTSNKDNKPLTSKGIRQYNQSKNINSEDIEDNSNDDGNSGMDRSRKNSSRSASMPPDETDYYAHERSGTRSDPVEMSYLLNLSEKCENEITAYVCRLKPKPGALCLERCVELGIKPGPIFGQLKDGLDVTLPDGRVILSSDVRGPDDPGPVFIVLDIPSEDYLDSLEYNEEFKKYQQTALNDEDFACTVIHFTPSNIMNNSRYQSFMKKFSPSTVHMVLNELNEFSCSPSVQRLQYQLNQLDPQIFPLLDQNASLDQSDENKSPVRKKLKTTHDDTQISTAKLAKLNCQDDLQSSLIYQNVHTMSCFHLRPKKGLDRSQELKLTPEAYIEETSVIEGFQESLCNVKNELMKLEKNTKSNMKYPKVIFLGTGSCIPNKTRNTSGILIQLSETNNMLLDCGEGTFGQFVRHFKQRGELTEVLRNLKIVYVSHLHADHHIGLIGLLQERYKLLSQDSQNQTVPEIKLLAPRQISSWLDFYNKRFEKISHMFELIPNQLMLANATTTFLEEPIDLSECGISFINTCLVRHCPHAFGIAMDTNDGYKITYSGDTMPCEELVQIGRNSDLLIHEATMEDDLEGEARFKLHSTISQAIRVGNSMQARRILLTHFSQRYAKIPRIQNLEALQNVGLAFDHMQLSLHDFEKLPLMHECLKIMFTEHCEELEERAAKRALKKKLKNASRSPTPL